MKEQPKNQDPNKKQCSQCKQIRDLTKFVRLSRANRVATALP